VKPVVALRLPPLPQLHFSVALRLPFPAHCLLSAHRDLALSRLPPRAAAALRSPGCWRHVVASLFCLLCLPSPPLLSQLFYILYKHLRRRGDGRAFWCATGAGETWRWAAGETPLFVQSPGCGDCFHAAAPAWERRGMCERVSMVFSGACRAAPNRVNQRRLPHSSIYSILHRISARRRGAFCHGSCMAWRAGRGGS